MSVVLGGLKLTTFSSLCYFNKSPSTTNNWVRRTLTTTTTGGSERRFRRPIATTTTGSRWWCRITLCAPFAHLNIPRFSSNSSTTTNRTIFLGGFLGQNFFHSSTSLALASQRNRQGCNRKFLATRMAPTHSDHHHHHNDGKKPPPKLLTLPTILTIGRVAAVPLLVATFYVDSWWGPNATTVIFLAAAITDWLDGYLARKMKQGTAFGAFLDPVADKLMVAATLVLLCTKPFEAGVFGQAPWLLTVPAITIIGREITMSAVREWAASQDGKLSEAIAVNNLGKWKTATQMTALTILLATRDGSLIGEGTLLASGVVLLYISAWLSAWSLVVYMRKIWKVLLM